jgi:large subunit ribosomal protein L25
VSITVNVETRAETGSLRMKRMREKGNIPAILYGGNGDSVALTVAEGEVGKVIKSGSRSVQLVGSINQSAEVKSIQWDTFGNKVLHVDFVRT